MSTESDGGATRGAPIHEGGKVARRTSEGAPLLDTYTTTGAPFLDTLLNTTTGASTSTGTPATTETPLLDTNNTTTEAPLLDTNNTTTEAPFNTTTEATLLDIHNTAPVGAPTTNGAPTTTSAQSAPINMVTQTVASSSPATSENPTSSDMILTGKSHTSRRSTTEFSSTSPPESQTTSKTSQTTFNGEKSSRSDDRNVVKPPRGFKGFRNLTFQSPPRRVTITPVNLGHGDRDPIALPIISYHGREEEEREAREKLEKENHALDMGVVQVPLEITTQGHPPPDVLTTERSVQTSKRPTDKAHTSHTINTSSKYSHTSSGNPVVLSSGSLLREKNSPRTVPAKAPSTTSQSGTPNAPAQGSDANEEGTPGLQSTTSPGQVNSIVRLSDKHQSEARPGGSGQSSGMSKIITSASSSPRTVTTTPTTTTTTHNPATTKTVTTSRGTTTQSPNQDDINTDTPHKVLITRDSIATTREHDRIERDSSPSTVETSGVPTEAGLKTGGGFLGGKTSQEGKGQTTKSTISTTASELNVFTPKPTQQPPQVTTQTNYKTGNVTTAGAPFMLEGGSSNLLMILIPALFSAVILVVAVFVVVIIYRKKCNNNSTKYRKADEEEESNAVLEEKVYLELIYAKVDLSKRSRPRFSFNDEEATPLTSEDSSNNNNSLINKERPKPPKTIRTYKLPSCMGGTDPDMIYSDNSLDRVYENSGAHIGTLETPDKRSLSPKPSPARVHGKLFNRSSPAADKRRSSPAASKKSPRFQKREGKMSVSPERTPRSRRNSPSSRKSRSPPSPKISAAGCWQTNESEDEGVKSSPKKIAVPPVDYREEVPPVDYNVQVEARTEDEPPLRSCRSPGEPVACTSTCTGACGGACGGPAPRVPEKLPSVFMSRKNLPTEPEEDPYSLVANLTDPTYSVVNDFLPRPGAPTQGQTATNLTSLRSSGLSHSYDPVYVPRSDANAMSRRLDNAGYVTSKMQRLMARGGTEMDILTSVRDNRPIPTIIGPPIMRRRPASRSDSDRSNASGPTHKSSQIYNPLHHVYSSVDGERNSSSTEPDSAENVYATVTEDDEDNVHDVMTSRQTAAERIYDSPDDSTPDDDATTSRSPPDVDETYANVTADIYYSAPPGHRQGHTTNNDSNESSAESVSDNPYEAVLFSD